MHECAFIAVDVPLASEVTLTHRMFDIQGRASHLELEELLHLPDLGLKGSRWRPSTLQTSWEAVEALQVFLLTVTKMMTNEVFFFSR